MEKARKVFIVILNWNNSADTINCIKSLSYITYQNYEVVIVDNNSDDDDVKMLTEEFGNRIHLIKNKSNLGFSGGNNIGIKYALKAGAEYILLLNNDTVVEPDFLTNLINSPLNNKKTGIITPLINYEANRDKVWLAGGYISKLKASGFPYYFNRNEKEVKESRKVSFASGCCMLIKVKLLETIGVLDENYFLYVEDTDYCQRTLDEGYEIVFEKESKIYHKVNSTTTKLTKALPLYYSVRNRLYFAKKLFGNWFYPAYLYVISSILLKTLFWFFYGKNDMIKMAWKGVKDFHSHNIGKLV